MTAQRRTDALGETWKPVVGYEGFYEVSDLGRVKGIDRLIPYKGGITRALKRGKILAMPPDKAGYRHGVFCREGVQKTVYTSRLVAEAFIPNPDNLPEVAHRDHNPLNNVVSNLEWSTHKDNINDSVRASHYAKKLTAQIVAEIRTRVANGESQASVARGLSIRYMTVHLIVNRKSWSHI